MYANTLALSDITITAPRARAVSRRSAAKALRSASRVVRTQRGLVLFDDRGRYMGTIDLPAGAPEFGVGADTVLLRRE